MALVTVTILILCILIQVYIQNVPAFIIIFALLIYNISPGIRSFLKIESPVPISIEQDKTNQKCSK